MAAQLTQQILLACWGSQARSSLLCCYFTPWNNPLPPDTRVRDGVNAEFDKCSFFQSASFSQPVSARTLPCDSSSARSSSSRLQLLQPQVQLKRSPKLAQLPPACPALPGAPLNSGNDTIPAPTATGAGYSLHWTTESNSYFTPSFMTITLYKINKFNYTSYQADWNNTVMLQK